MNIILWIWQFPQHLLALLLLLIFRGTKDKGFYKIVSPKWWEFGASLGNYVMFSEQYVNSFILFPKFEDQTVKHEQGHSIQSRWLGPLYLPTVGLVSATQNLICRIIPYSKYAKDYYKRWPENWADKLAGIKR